MKEEPVTTVHLPVSLEIPPAKKDFYLQAAADYEMGVQVVGETGEKVYLRVQRGVRFSLGEYFAGVDQLKRDADPGNFFSPDRSLIQALEWLPGRFYRQLLGVV